MLVLIVIIMLELSYVKIDYSKEFEVKVHEDERGRFYLDSMDLNGINNSTIIILYKDKNGKTKKNNLIYNEKKKVYHFALSNVDLDKDEVFSCKVLDEQITLLECIFRFGGKTSIKKE